MAGIEIDWQGLNTVQGYIRNGPESGARLVKSQLVKAAHRAFAMSQEQVPRRTGALAGSGALDTSALNDDEGAIVITYGGAASKYALFVHENLTAHHKPPTKAKYVEDPVRAVQVSIEDQIGVELEAAMVMLYPQAPAEAVQSEIGGATKAQARSRAASLRSGRGVRRLTPKPMSNAEIHAALHRIDTGTGKGWQRAT